MQRYFESESYGNILEDISYIVFLLESYFKDKTNLSCCGNIYTSYENIREGFL